ncbi:hypothetical protein [Streptomyces sp. NPDC021224]|uniref:hypothetical protein n=1 Tax=unclassified Streptomyces TaxID=2593676 RepID=UPI0037A5A42F
MPVTYVLVPQGATAKTLVTEFARYLGSPTPTRTTRTQTTDPSATPTPPQVSNWSSSTRSTASTPHRHRSHT